MSVVKIGTGVYAAEPQIANGVQALDGYKFIGMPYYYDPESQFANPTDPSKWTVAPINAVDIWCLLQSDPNYASLPPITSISVDAPVSGTVDDASVSTTPTAPAVPSTPPPAPEPIAPATPAAPAHVSRLHGPRGTRF